MNGPTMTPVFRLLAATAGTALMAGGARRRGFTDAGMGIGGLGLLCLALVAPAPERTMPRDIVDVASEDSFPASDPPSFW